MNKKNRKVIAGIFLLAAILLFCVIAPFVVRKSLENRLTVENRSGVAITHITVALSNSVVTSDVITFDNIVPGQTVTSSYIPRGDSSFYIAGELADGTEFKGSFGYTTNGMTRERAYVTLMPEGKIEFEQKWD